MNSPKRIGFVGGWGHHYSQGFPSADASIASAVCGDGYDENAAKSVCARLKAEWYESFDEMLNTFHPDLVSVGSVYGKAGQFIIQALDANLPVVSDKPIAADWETFHTIQRVANSRPCSLVTEYDMRARPEFRGARSVPERDLPTQRSTWRRSRRVGG